MHGKGSDPLLDLARFRDRIKTVDAGVTAIRAHHGIEDAQGRAFPGSVPVQQSGYAAVVAVKLKASSARTLRNDLERSEASIITKRQCQRR